MSFLDDNRQRATWLILLLGAGIIYTLAPYSSGLIGGLVLYVVFQPVYAWLARWVRPSIAAAAVVVLVLLVLGGPGVALAGLILDQAQSMAAGVLRGPLLDRLSSLHIGRFAVGPQLAGFGEKIVAWLGTSAFGLIGTATRLALNLTISLFCLYYLLIQPKATWEAVKPYIPFSESSAEQLRTRFRDVTTSTIIGTGLNACVQGIFVGVGFWLTGLPNAVFWGVVTAVFAILPVVGSGLVWGPGVLSLVLSDRYGAALGLFLLGVVVVANVDLVIRPLVFRRYAQIHPLVTLIGAIGGVAYFGLLGLLIGPLALSYFFELIRMYKEEYLKG